MQGWLFLTFIVVGSLVGITGMRLFFFDPLPTTALNVTWFVLQILPLLLTLPSAMRGNLKGMFFFVLGEHPVFSSGRFDHFRSRPVLLGRCRGVFRPCPMRHYCLVRPQTQRV